MAFSADPQTPSADSARGLPDSKNRVQTFFADPPPHSAEPAEICAEWLSSQQSGIHS